MSADTPLGRLREALLPDVDVRSAVLCTYGLDPRFVEAEVLPALLPTRLATDAAAGSLSAYLFDADETTAQIPIEVFYDHITGEGPQLKLGYQKVTLGTRAFHAKLLIAEYADRLRLVVGSANLTRPGWTSLFELFVVEDLIAGQPHGWAAGLRSFLTALGAQVGRRGPAVDRILARLAAIGESPEPTLHHSFDGQLLEHAFPPGQVRQIDIVSPFFEGEDGEGIFDELAKRYPDARLRLFLASSTTEAGYVVIGPPAKLAALRAGGADLQLVQSLWDDVDDDRAPERRGLHGKLFAIDIDGQRWLTIGSANATRAALLRSVANGGNVELIVTASATQQAVRRLLPPSFAAPDDVVFSAADSSEEDEPPVEDAAKWVTSATFTAAASELRLHLADGAPRLTVAYDGRELGVTEASDWTSPFTFGAEAFVTVDSGDGPAIVPVIVLDPELLGPRGAPRDLDLESLADLLAGHRLLIHPPGNELPLQDSSTMGTGGKPIFGRGAIPWRRILAGLRGLQDDLVSQLGRPEAIRWTLANPLRFGGLLDHFEAARDRGRFLDGDLAFAFHESLRMLGAVLGTAEFGPGESRALIQGAADDVRSRLDALLTAADPSIRAQMQILRTETAA